MKPVVCYPVPMESTEAWLGFRDSIPKFADSFAAHPGDCEIALILCHTPASSLKVPLNELIALGERFRSAHISIHAYPGGGCDIGGAQWLSKRLPPERLMIMLTTRCYFHRDGWLGRYVDAHEKHPNALLGASASREGGRRHICTRAYAMRAGLFAAYPHAVNSREDGQAFEISPEKSITDWFCSQGLECLQVTFDGVQPESEWRNPDNIYRKGDQSNMLVWDRHTDIYRTASEAEKARLTAICEGS